jgi:hypothetical protein
LAANAELAKTIPASRTRATPSNPRGRLDRDLLIFIHTSFG